MELIYLILLYCCPDLVFADRELRVGVFFAWSDDGFSTALLCSISWHVTFSVEACCVWSARRRSLCSFYSESFQIMTKKKHLLCCFPDSWDEQKGHASGWGVGHLWTKKNPQKVICLKMRRNCGLVRQVVCCELRSLFVVVVGGGGPLEKWGLISADLISLRVRQNKTFFKVFKTLLQSPKRLTTFLQKYLNLESIILFIC